MTAASTPTPEAIARLRAALADYEGATLGRLNVTAEALQHAAKACGWSWRDGGGVTRWTRAFLETQTDGAAR